MASICGYHHVAIRTRDFDKSLAFYRQVLGSEIHRLWGEGDHRGVLLTLGNGNLLELLASDALATGPDDVLIHFALATDDVPGMVDRAVAAGAEVASAYKTLDIQAEPSPFRGCNAFIKGPDGELVEFFQELS